MTALKVGVDVPWMTSWSGEAVTGVSPCPSIDGGLAVGQADHPGEGQPLYSQNHLFRQRKAVREMLCPMCGAPTPAGDRWTQTGQPTTAKAVRAKGLGGWLPAGMKDSHALLDAGSIPPLHRACAERALIHCPHLEGMADHQLKPFPVGWLIIPLTVEATPPAPPGNLPRASMAVVTFLQLLGVEV